MLCLRDPVIEEVREPPANAVIIDRAVSKMLVPLFSARQFHARRTACGPAAHHRVGDLGMKLDRERRTGAKRLDWKHVALGKQLRAARQSEALAMPLVHVVRPVADRASGRRGANLIIADLGLALRMRR